MYLPKLKNIKNTVQKRIQEFEGLNRTCDIKDNEFCELYNVSANKYPYLSTRKGRTLAFSQGLHLATGDNDNQSSYFAGTGLKKLPSGSEFYYRGNKLYNFTENNFQQVVKMNNDFVLFPKLYAVSAMTDGSQVVSSRKTNFETEWIAESYNGASSIYYTDIWFELTNTTSYTQISVETSKILLDLPNKIANGTIKAGDRLNLKFFTVGRSPLSGYDPGLIYLIKNISKDSYNTKVYILQCECYDSNGNRILPNEISISGYDLSKDLKHAVMYKVTDAKLGASYQGRLFACDQVGMSLFCSSKSNYQSFAYADGAARIDTTDSGKWTGIKKFNGYLYLFKQSSIYRLMGSLVSNYQLNWINGIGCINQDSLCEYNSILYYLGKDGIYAFDGNDSKKISNKLNRVYKRGVFGAYSGKLYCYLEGESQADNEFLVYDIYKKLWHKEDLLAVNSFVQYADGLYAVTDNGCYKLAAEEQDVPFAITTKQFFYHFADKAINQVSLFAQMSDNTTVTIEVAYDGGTFSPCGTVRGGGVKRIPVKLKKCSAFALRLSGTGKFTLMDMEFSVWSDKKEELR